MKAEQIGKWVVDEFRALGRVITMQQAVETYKIADTILVSRISEPDDYVQQYTDALEPRQPVKVVAGVQVQTREVTISTGKRRRGHDQLERRYVFSGVKLRLDVRQIQKYLIKSNDRVHSNGDVVIAAELPKNVNSELRHAFTVHSVQGETVPDESSLFVDTRRMFEVEHWYTALSRAQFLAQVWIVYAPPPPPSEVYRHTKIYRIVNDTSDDCYVGHTTASLEERLAGHMRPSKRKRCSSESIVRCRSSRIELLEE